MTEIIHKKSIKVNEPEHWYNKSYITVYMFVLPDNTTVRIFFESIDDFHVYQDFNEWDKTSNIEWAKEYMWDILPDSISLKWLYQHGYRPY